MTRLLGVALLLPALMGSARLQNDDPGRVTGLRLAPADGGAELVIEVDGAVNQWTDFSLDAPPRVVLDLTGATKALDRANFEQIDRGGIAGVRTSQYSADVVRVVVDLDSIVAYSVTRAADGLHVRFSGVAGSFAPWTSDAAAAGQLATAPAPQRNDAEGAQTPPAPITSAAPAVQQQPRISVTFQDADIHDVLASFAEFSGRSIVPGSGVTGTVTATITNQPWDVALNTILTAYGLAAEELPSGIIEVDAIENLQTRQTQEPLITRTFAINYVPVADLMTSLTPLTSDRGKISASQSTNTLIVTDVPSVVEDLGRMIQRLDVRTPQVTIEAKIVFVNRTRARELGVTYDLKDSRGNSLNKLVSVPDPANPGTSTNQDLVLLGGNSIAALGNANVRVQGPQLQSVMSLVLGRFTLVTFLDALQSMQLSDVQASPLITTLDNQEASIKVGERTPIRVVDLAGPGAVAGGGQGGIAAPRATAELVETGIILRVTPHITADRHVLMNIHAERSNAQLASTDIGVSFQQQVGETRVMVRNGETAVIGGLTVTELGNTTAGIPILMDLPVIGRLFRTERKNEIKRDLLIMVTPHIVNERPATAP